MIIGFRQEFDAAGFRQGVKRAEHFRRITLELLQQDPGDAVGDLESALIPACEIQKQAVSGQIALVRHFPANRTVLVIVEILVVFVENRVMS